MIEITKWLVDALLTMDAIGTGQVKLSISSTKKVKLSIIASIRHQRFHCRVMQ